MGVGVSVGVLVGVGVEVGDGVGVGVCVGVGVGVGVGVKVGVGVGVGIGEGLGVGVGSGTRDGVATVDCVWARWFVCCVGSGLSVTTSGLLHAITAAAKPAAATTTISTDTAGFVIRRGIRWLSEFIAIPCYQSRVRWFGHMSDAAAPVLVNWRVRGWCGAGFVLSSGRENCGIALDVVRNLQLCAVLFEFGFDAELAT